MKTIVIEKSPLLEAACLLEFVGGETRDFNIPDRFHERIKSIFPNRRETRAESGVPNDAHPIRLTNSEDSIAINIGLNRLSVNQASLDATWLTLQKNIMLALNEFWEVGRPEHVSELSLRYINRFVMPEEPSHYDDFLRAHPTLPQGKRDLPWVDWAQSVTILCREINGLLSISSGINVFNEPENSDKSYVYLDLTMRHFNMSDDRVESSYVISREEIPSWLESSHEEIRRTFFDSLTDLSKSSIGYKEL